MLAEAKKLAAERGLGNVRTSRAKAEDVPFPDMSFDLVTCGSPRIISRSRELSSPRPIAC